MNFKKLLSLVGAMALTFGMVACGDDATGAGDDDGVTISEITLDPSDGSYGVEVAFPAGSEVEDVEYKLTEGSGTWQFSGDDLYDGLNADSTLGYSNYFEPSCSGDFEVTVSYTLDGSAGSKVVSKTIEDEDLDACSDEPTSSSSTTTSSSSIANVPFTMLDTLTMGAQGAAAPSGIDLDTWTLFSTSTAANEDIDLVFGSVSGALTLFTASASDAAGFGNWGSVTPNAEVLMAEVDMTSAEYEALEDLADFDAALAGDPIESIEVSEGTVLWVMTSLTATDIYLIHVNGTDGTGETASVSIKGLSAEQPAE